MLAFAEQKIDGTCVCVLIAGRGGVTLVDVDKQGLAGPMSGQAAVDWQAGPISV
jgi:hypothetical protein